MGCGGSKPSRQEGHTEPGVQLADVRRQPAQARVRHGDAESRPHRTTRAMTEPIRREFLTALDRAFGALDYGVIGGTALAEYGNDRATSDIDVIIPDGISDVVEEQLIRGGLVRTAGGGIGYVDLNLYIKRSYLQPAADLCLAIVRATGAATALISQQIELSVRFSRAEAIPLLCRQVELD